MDLRGVVTAWRIRRFVIRELLDEPHDGGDPLATSEMDSLQIEQLVAYLEESFGIAFRDREVVAKNFSSVHTLAALVNEKRRTRGAGGG